MADAVLPKWAMDWRSRRWLAREVGALRRIGADPSLDAVVEAVMRSEAFRPQQKPSEIVALLRLVREAAPSRVLEVGGRRGGTLRLFAHVAAPTARLLSIDLAYPRALLHVAPRLGGPRQDVRCMIGDSHAPETAARVRDWLEGEGLDFLFLDGDHTLTGVRQDFESFGPLVREGGLIAFHDIVPDSMTRYGVRTAAYAGEVPTFWEALKGRGAVSEIVADPAQDGMGIGVVAVSGAWRHVLDGFEAADASPSLSGRDRKPLAEPEPVGG